MTNEIMNEVMTVFERNNEVFVVSKCDSDTWGTLYDWLAISDYTWEEYFGQHAEVTIENMTAFMNDEDNQTIMDDGAGCGGFDTYEDALEDMNAYINGTHELF